MLSLYTEIIVSILGASLLGLIAGWMIQKSLGKGKLAGAIASWEDRLIEAEDNARRDSEHLEDQLQSLGDEVKSLNESNRSLKETLKDNETGVQQARTDAMDLNRQQAETQERLQRIIQEKEQEIAELHLKARDNRQNMSIAGEASTSTVAAASLIDNSSDGFTVDTEIEESLTMSIEDQTEQTESLENEIQQLIESEADHTETVAVANTMTETLDDTARLSTTSSHPVVGTLSDDPFDVTFDTTADMDDNGIALEEATLALDDDALRFARTPRRRD